MRKFKAFKSRIEAGLELAMRFESEYRNRPDVVVLFVSQNSVPIAHEVARGLHAPTMDVFLSKDIPVPGTRGARVGIVTTGGLRMIRTGFAARLGISTAWADSSAHQELALLERDEGYFRGQRPATDLHRKRVIIVDDGFSPTSLLLDSIRAIRQAKASKVILAIPIVTPVHRAELNTAVDRIVGVQEAPKEEVELAWYGPFQEVNREQVRLHLLLWKPEERIAA